MAVTPIFRNICRIATGSPTPSAVSGP